MATIHLYLASTNHQSTNITAITPAAWVVILRYADHQKALNDGGYGHTETSLALSALTTALATLKRHDLPVHIHTTTEQVVAVISEQRYLSWQQNNWDVPEADRPTRPTPMANADSHYRRISQPHHHLPPRGRSRDDHRNDYANGGDDEAIKSNSFPVSHFGHK